MRLPIILALALTLSIGLADATERSASDLHVECPLPTVANFGLGSD